MWGYRSWQAAASPEETLPQKSPGPDDPVEPEQADEIFKIHKTLFQRRKLFKMKKRIFRVFAGAGVALWLIMPFAATEWAVAAESEKVAEGSTRIVDKTTRLNELSIGKGASIKAPDGHTLTMTVDGIETPVNPGDYKGKIVLTVAEDIIVNKESFGTKTKYSFRAAIDVEDGAVIEKRSVMAAVTGGKVTNTSAKDVKITSVGDNFNGIYVRTGESNKTPFPYLIENLKINFTGNGGDDFAGYGAAIAASGYADVTVNKAEIITDGVIRSAAFVGGNATLHVNNSYIHTGSPAQLPKVVTGMMEVPWMLGLTGTCRSTMLCDNGTAYYTNTHIVADGWGALSTDSVKSVKLYVTKCTIDLLKGGYGSYADGASLNSFSGCTFNVKDMALIMTQGSGVFTDGTVVNSQRYGVMAHSGFGSNSLTIDKGSVFNTKEAAILLKSTGPAIIVDNAKLNSENGIILQAMVNDDPNMSGGGMGGPGSAPMGGGMPAASGSAPGASGGAPGGMPQGGAPTGGAPVAGGQGPQGGMPGGSSSSSDFKATFKNVTLKGDIINSMTSLGDGIITFENAVITGAVTTATTALAGEKPTKEKYYLIGAVKNTYCATNDKYGMKLSLDDKSKWVIDKTSYLTVLTIARGAIVTAPQGYKLTMTVDGVDKQISAGTYKGKIVLKVAKI
jgi:hypothetical protein